MMPLRVEPTLAKRLEALTGEEAACCVLPLQATVRAVRKAPAFDAALRRAKALADEKRLLALALLKRKGELCACEVQAALGLTHATVSHHMGVLLDAGLVASERRGKWTYYRATDDALPLIP